MQEELQVPWPLVTAALDNNVSTNVNCATLNDCNESQLFINQKITRYQDQSNSNIRNNPENINCIQLSTPSFSSETLRITAPSTSCLMKNVHTAQNSSIITFPPLQSIRFVQANFQTTIEHSSTNPVSDSVPLCTQIQNSAGISQHSHINLPNSVHTSILNKNQTDQVHKLEIDNEIQDQTQSIVSGSSIHEDMQTQSTIVLQQQTLLPLSPRQIITTLQPHSHHYPMIMNLPSKTNRSSTVQSINRSSRNANREQSNSRLRSVTKEPPGAVNLERSYQICQAVSIFLITIIIFIFNDSFIVLNLLENVLYVIIFLFDKMFFNNL